MIWLVPILVLFFPGNLILFACALLLCGGLRDLPKLELPQFLFLAWMAWAFVGCCVSGNHLVALIGNVNRMEGWVFWFLCAFAARLFAQEQERAMMLPYLILLSLWPWAILHFKGILILPGVVDGGYGVMAGAILASIHPVASLIGLVPIVLVTEGMRSAAVAFVGAMATYAAFSWRLRPAALAILFALGLFAFTKVGAKMKTIHGDSIGSGTRTQLMLQVSRIAAGDGYYKQPEGVRRIVIDGKPTWQERERLIPTPWWRPFIGVGMDMGKFYLEQGAGKTQPANRIPLEPHSVLFDILLKTGWVGLTLALLCFGSCLGAVWNFRSTQNIMFLSMIVGWAVMGMFNPQGWFTHLMMVTAVFNVRTKL